MTLTIDEKFALLQDMKVIDNNRQIVERLKKEIEETKKFPNSIYYPILQKILGENNG